MPLKCWEKKPAEKLFAIFSGSAGVLARVKTAALRAGFLVQDALPEKIANRF
jgi:hypothetical protein